MNKTVVCPRCKTPIKVEGEPGSYDLTCPKCSHSISVTIDSPKERSLEETQHIAPPEAPATVKPMSVGVEQEIVNSQGGKQVIQFRVASLNDRDFFSGKLSAESIQVKLNEMAKDGWIFKQATTAHWPNWLGTNQEEVLMFFEKKS